MQAPFSRRRLLQAGMASAALPLSAFAQPSGFAPKPAGWRRYALTTTVDVAEPQGRTQLWLPVPDIDSDWQRSLDNKWSGNATRAAIVSDPVRSVRMLHAEFAPGITAPTLTLPGSAAKGTLPFLMYPNGENASGAFDALSRDTFRYTISARAMA